MDANYPARRNIDMYVMDLLLGYEPWLNLTTACTFPDTKLESNTQSVFTNRNHFHGPVLRALYGDKNTDLSRYTGTYGNLGYGNISISSDGTVDSVLYMRYGSLARWKLTPKDLSSHTFTA